ncbi:hypothetical protein BKA93DRAFT_498591 [Sparassis latifolia]
MTHEQSKSSTANGQEHLHPIAPYPPPPSQYNGHYPPPPGAYAAQYYSFAPVADGSHDSSPPNGHPGAPFLMAYPPPPPGLVYAYAAPPPGQAPAYPPFAPGLAIPQPPRPKRKQVKMACTNCASACKRCNETRPCDRCVKYGITDTCVDGVRKERKKGVKRGPYKRKNRLGEGGDAGEASGESSVPTPAYPMPPEGYYPWYYPPPGYMQPPHDGQHPEGTQNGNGQPMVPQFYPLHPIYAPPPYGPYPGGAIPYPPPSLSPVGTMPPAPAANGRAAEQSPNDNAGENGTRAKKRSRAKNGDDSSKVKKAKAAAAAAAEPQPQNDIGRGKDLHLTGDNVAALNGHSNGNGAEVRTLIAA